MRKLQFPICIDETALCVYKMGKASGDPTSMSEESGFAGHGTIYNNRFVTFFRLLSGLKNITNPRRYRKSAQKRKI